MHPWECLVATQSDFAKKTLTTYLGIPCGFIADIAMGISLGKSVLDRGN